jgi:hypothetical protein
MTRITVEEIRLAAGVKTIVLPPGFGEAEIYDKWGNIILPNGMRMRGPLFDEEPVQRAVGKGGLLGIFTHWCKYPSTPHLPWSPGLSRGDTRIENLEGFVGSRVIGTVKMDGESWTGYRDHMHARSLDCRHHESRDWAKRFWNGFRWDIPERWRICAENLYAQHSIAYRALSSYLYGFSVWDDRNVRLAWDDCLDWFGMLGIDHVPIFYDGL